MFFKVDFAKAYDSVRWDYLLDVLEAFGFGQTWCNWIRGTLSSAKVSILVNGSPSKEFSCYRGLKQGDPLAPYLFILVMESLHLSFSRAVDEGLFKGEWSDGNLKGIINILKSLFLASGLQINILKSQLLGVGVPRYMVDQAASSIGCSIMNNQFRYLGVMVGECSSRLKAWDDIILKLRSRLSKWKVKTLSIGVRLTLLKAVLDARFFNGADQSDKKITWVAWDKVLASKKHGGLGVSSFFALNRALLLKWVWRFVSQDGSLWCQVIRALYGSSVGSHLTHLSFNWCSIVRELHKLKGKGFDFWSHFKKRIGNGNDMRFWSDCLIGDMPLYAKFPRLFALELDKEALVAVKLSAPVDNSFRRSARGGLEQHLMAVMNSMLDPVSLTNSCDRWFCDLASDGDFRVKEVRNFIDDLFLPSQDVPTRWVKSIPIKIRKVGPRSRSGSPGSYLSGSHPRLNLCWRVFSSLLGGLFGGKLLQKLYYECDHCERSMLKILTARIMDNENKRFETCEEEEGYGEEDDSISTEEYDLEDDCEAELDEITETLDPHQDIEVAVGIEAENSHHDGKETYLDNSDVDNLDEEIIEDETVELRRTKVRFPRYDENCKIVTFSIGQLFTDHKQFKRALLKYVVQENKYYIFKKNARHTCSKVFWISHVKSPWIIEHYEAMIYAHPGIKPTYILDTIKAQVEIEVTRNQCKRANALVMKRLERDVLNEYKKLNDYAKALVDTNPVNSVDIVVEHIGTRIPFYFKRMYVCLAAVREGFLDRCRKYLGLDDCFLKGVVKGMLLTAVEHLKVDIKTKDGGEWTFMFDKQKHVVNGRSNGMVPMSFKFIMEELKIVFILGIRPVAVGLGNFLVSHVVMLLQQSE
nr:RNA-directed DNA polymerase, eukaryota, reverse transcriptase zinc-binding domain protein [Tanacetum cinerariifolium]